MGNENSNRRRFLRKLAKLVAAGGVATLLLGQLQEKKGLPLVEAADGDALIIGQSNTGTSTTILDSSGGMCVRSVGTIGVEGRSYSTSGSGVFGWATATSGWTWGVRGQSDSVNGTGVVGNAIASSGLTRGVYGSSSSTSGRGVYGVAIASGGVGVFGEAGNAGAKPIVAMGASGQTANLQEWQNSAGTPLSVVDAAGKLGVGIAAPVRQVHLQGNNAVFRMDRDVNSSAFILVRTASGDFATVWKTFYVGVDASGVNDGSFFIGDVGTAVSGPSTKRLFIDNSGRVGIGTEAPSEKLHVVGKVRATQGFITGDIEFANGYKLTEDRESGLLFMNQKGEKIAKLDEQGNLRIRGKIIQET